jgi:hypothetical protein
MQTLLLVTVLSVQVTADGPLKNEHLDNDNQDFWPKMRKMRKILGPAFTGVPFMGSFP